MDNLNITERKHNEVIVVDLHGNIRAGKDVVWLRHKLKTLAERGEKQIILNMAEIAYIDSSGLGEMVAGFVSVKKNGGSLKLLNLTDRVSELMVITKLLTVFEAFDEELAAVESFNSPATTEIPIFERNRRVATAERS